MSAYLGEPPYRHNQRASVQLPPRRLMTNMADLPDQARHDMSMPGRAPGRQSPLPWHPASFSHEGKQPGSFLHRGASHRSVHSVQSIESRGTRMEDEDEDDDVAESENESVTSDTNRPSKKKKGQRFFCTDFPPCALSFTRSEHLARHIRKHTGERPFQCHCLRRFSRLDNLRQHAQTVHLNEDIPGDSLAATGTRFQRQIRTDRVRPPNRTRAVTMTSQGSHGRGHSRNLSGSSIGSTASEMPPPEDYRRRQMPLAMAQNHTPRIPLTLDTLGANNNTPQSYETQYNNYSSGYTTPTSVFSATSPAASSVHSPGFVFPRPQSTQWGHSSRRLSVPSAPYQSPGWSRPNSISYMTPLQSSTASTFSESGTMEGPASQVARAEAAATEADMRRRTWHPGTFGGYGTRLPTSGLVHYQTPDAPEPVTATQPAAAQNLRLPGIDSFDRAHAYPVAPPRRPPHIIDADTTPRLKHPREVAASDTSSRRDSWDSMNHNLTQLNIATPPREKAVPRNSIYNAPPPIMGRTFAPLSGSEPVLQHAQIREPPPPGRPSEPEVILADPPTTPRRAKRQAWYNGPVTGTLDTQFTFPHLRRSPGSSSSDGVQTPATHAGGYQPAIVHSNGYVEPYPPAMGINDPQKAYTLASGTHRHPLQPLPPRNAVPVMTTGNNTARLDALVAVATSGEQYKAQAYTRPV